MTVSIVPSVSLSTELPLVVYPRVMEDNTLEFDASGPIPELLPYFTRHPDIPNRFIPEFQACQHRGFVEKKLTNCSTCTKKRKMWYCELLQMDVFPIICAKCTVENK